MNYKDEMGCTPLIHAAMIGDINVMKFLIDAGADVNRNDCKGNTALLISSQQDRSDIVKLLINSGADVNIPDKTGKTALMMASEQGNDNMIVVLLKSGADVNTVDSDDATALSIAISTDRRRCIEVLVDAGASVNIRNDRGETPLMFAARNGDISLIRLLLKSGVEINRTINLTNVNFLMYHIVYSQTVSRNIMRFLFVAGEDFNPECLAVKMERYVEKSDFFTEVEERSLIEKCRTTIRHNLLDVNSHRNLFYAIAELGLPRPMEDYLLYNETLSEA